ncbi:hypothetical protein C0989_007449, partial [Termitomyces sp. Mn162]
MPSDLTFQLKKHAMAQAFLNRVDHLLTIAHDSLATNPHLDVTAIFKIWLCWFETVGSEMEWAELATVDKECWQLYEKYKEEDWIQEFNKHFAPLLPLLEFLVEDLETGMVVSASAVTKTGNAAK